MTRFLPVFNGEDDECGTADKGKAGEYRNSPDHRSDGSLSTNDMWGGRFAAGPDEVMAAINVSIGFDRRMAKQDLEGSLAHVRMLEAKGLISPADLSAIQSGLDTIKAEIQEGRFPFRRGL